MALVVSIKPLDVLAVDIRIADVVIACSIPHVANVYPPGFPRQFAQLPQHLSVIVYHLRSAAPTVFRAAIYHGFAFGAFSIHDSASTGHRLYDMTRPLCAGVCGLVPTDNRFGVAHVGIKLADT